MQNKSETTSRETVQNESIKEWYSNNKRGTVVLHTGLGKSFVFFKAIYSLRDILKKKNFPILFLSEETGREKDIRQAAKDFKKIFGKNPFKDFDIQFHCYQTAYKWINKKFLFVCADEIHDSMTPAYAKFYKYNKMEYLLGLTATPNETTEYELKKGNRTVKFTKEDLYKKYCPIVYRYNIEEAQEDKTTREIVTYILLNELDSKEKKYKQGGKLYTEEELYKKYEAEASYYRHIKAPARMRKALGIEVADFLHNLESKTLLAKDLVTELEKTGKSTLIFGERISAITYITPNIPTGEKTTEENEEILENFTNRHFNTLGSVKKLRQGKNIERHIDNIVLHSYSQSKGALVQRIGRARLSSEKVHLFVIATKGTKEPDIVLNKFSPIFAQSSRFDSVEELINYYKKKL